MKSSRRMLLLTSLIASTLIAQDAQVTPVMSKDVAEGGKEITLTPGQSFYEAPNDIHTIGRNASTTKPAKFIVVLLKDKGAPVVLPVNPTSASVYASPKLDSGEK